MPDSISDELKLKILELIPESMGYEKQLLLSRGKVYKSLFYYLLDDESCTLNLHELEIIRQNVQMAIPRRLNPPLKIAPELVDALVKRIMDRS